MTRKMTKSEIVVALPIYRAKELKKEDYIEFQGFLPISNVNILGSKAGCAKLNDGTIVDLDYLSISLPKMVDKNKTRVFASLNDEGKGGDLVKGTCRDVMDKDLHFHKPLEFFNALLRFYQETSCSVVVETTDRYVTNTGYIVESGSVFRWSDCRQDIEVVGIKNENIK